MDDAKVMGWIQTENFEGATGVTLHLTAISRSRFSSLRSCFEGITSSGS
jgi:hypothetical protein